MNEHRKLPILLKAMYGAGSGGISLIGAILVMWAAYYYAPPSGRGLITYAPIALLGIAMMVGRGVDAISDPLIGQWSDRARSRLGRRIPFILFGSVPLVLSFILIWTPPIPGNSMVNFIYLAVMMSVFWLFYTIVACPYLALLPELSTSSEERVSLATWQALFKILGVLIGMVGSSFLIEKMGFKAMAIILGVVSLLAFFCPVIVVREKGRDIRKSELAFGQSVLQTFRNRPFNCFVSSYLCFWFAFTILSMGISYIVTVLMGLDEGDVGLVAAPALAISILCFPLVSKISARRGKKFTLTLSLALLCIIFFLIPTIGQWPFNISKALQGRILLILSGVPITALFVLPNAIIADLVDYDEKQTGSRREAMYFGMQGLLLKATIGLASLFFGFLMSMFGYSSAKPLGIILLGPIAGGFVLVGLLIFSRYPITT